MYLVLNIDGSQTAWPMFNLTPQKKCIYATAQNIEIFYEKS